MPHPRQLISKNYHHLGSHPLLSSLFPRENLVGGTRRLKNLSEFLSPSVQQTVGVGTDDDPGNDDDDADAGPGGGGHWNGSYHCPSFKTKGKCFTSRGSLPYTNTMYTFLLPKRTSSGGSYIAVRILPATSSTLAALWMCARGGPVLRRPAWTVTVWELGCTNILRMGIQLGVEGRS